MINIFNFAAKDQTLVYLAQIFGSVNGLIVPPDQGNTGFQIGGTISILGTMFQVFNTIVLIVATLVAVYVTVIGVMATAHEGEFLGKHWHKLWTPLRMVLGIAALFPTGSGYSGIQIIMMWVILQGVGARYDMDVSIKLRKYSWLVYTQPSIPRTDVNYALKGLFQGLVCDATLREQGPNPDTGTTQSHPYYCP